MQALRAPWPDWRDAAAYAPLLDADRSLLAWEWLRRTAGYRAAAGRALGASSEGADAAGAAARFGLVAFEPAWLSVPDARPLWRADFHPYVLRAEIAGAGPPADLFELDRMSGIARLIVADETEHLLLSDGRKSIRLDGAPGTFGRGPVRLRYSIEGLATAEPPLLTLRRFLALCRGAQFSRSLHGREVRARRWILILRAWDALATGADQRRIAGELLSRTAVGPRWRSRESSVRSQVQRLVRQARQFAGGGYPTLLH